MDLTTLIGILAGFAMLVISIVIDGDIGMFYDLRSIVLVLGGTIAATVISCQGDQLRNIPRVLRIAFRQRETPPEQLVSTVVQLAHKARREGLLALEEDADESDDEFMQKGIQLVVDGADPEMVRNIMEIELSALEERHAVGQNVFQTMGTYAPAFGMLGTLVGLVQMLQTLDDPESIGPGMALALLTTLYGVVLANLVFNPIAQKLKAKSEREIQMKQVIIEGILSIQAGENPRMIERKLWAFLSPRASRERAAQAGMKAEAAVSDA